MIWDLINVMLQHPRFELNVNVEIGKLIRVKLRKKENLLLSEVMTCNILMEASNLRIYFQVLRFKTPHLSV